MKKLLRFTCLAFLQSIGLLSFAQEASPDSVQQDPYFKEGQKLYSVAPISIRGNSSHENSILVSAADKVSNLAEFLQDEGHIYIKTYGLGSLATSSVRGGSAAQTLVLWNGLPISSPMLGQLDLSLLPVSSFQSVSLEKGGSSSLWGSGAVAGTIALNPSHLGKHDLAIEAGGSLGSFGLNEQEASLTFRARKLRMYSSTHLQRQSAENDFWYEPAPGVDLRQQTNAQFDQLSLVQQLRFDFNDRHQLSLHYWWQDADRQIPPTNTQRRSEARQEDNSHRAILSYKYSSFSKWPNLWEIKAKLAVFEESLQYDDAQFGIFSASRFRTLFADVQSDFIVGEKWQFLAGATHSFTEAFNEAYGDPQNESRTALFASIDYNFRSSSKWKATLVGRAEVIDSQMVPFVPMLKASYQLTDLAKIRIDLSRNYRAPTLNDRFWMPGGNPDLLPESGWSQELGLDHALGNEQLNFSYDLCLYNRLIDNWILWGVAEGNSFWSANNLSRVWSRGVEARFDLKYPLPQGGPKLSLGYDYNRSTNQVTLSQPRIEEGEQLIYTPVHQAFAQLSFDWGLFNIQYQHTYTGATEGINDPIDAFLLGNLKTSYTLKKGKSQLACFLRVNNIWNQTYLVLERRPMPGINFQAGLHITYQK
ncbi:MAG: TonB-dependent receptor [Bacteroidota bacterium]